MKWSTTDSSPQGRPQMPRRKFTRMTAAQFLLSGCVVAFGVVMAHAQGQQFAPPAPPPTTPTQAPVVNPSSPYTVPQPSYTPLAPSAPGTAPTIPSTVPSAAVTSPANEESPIETAQSEQPVSAAKARSLHRHRARSTLVTYSCGSLGCVRTYPWAFPCQYYSRYC